MLWIPGDTTDTWSAVVSALASSAPLDLVALLYPHHSGSDMPAPFTVSGAPERFESVTEWEPGETAIESGRLPVTEALLSEVASLPTDAFDAPWDLIAVRPGETSWLACAIPHEDMVMVSDDSTFSVLREHGIAAASEPPDWW